MAALFVAALSMALAPEGGGGSLFGARIALVELDGPIIDVDELLRELKGHRDNPLVKAVVIRINSPGGVVAPTQELHAALTRLRESGMRLASLDGLLKKVGVDFVVVKAGQLKDIGNFARAMTPEERRILQMMLDDVHGQFIDAVAAGRKLDRARVLAFADGRIVSGAQAKALNMVDALGGLEEALDGAAVLAGIPKPPRVVGPRRRLSIMDLVRNRLDLGQWSGVPPALSVFKTPLYLMD